MSFIYATLINKYYFYGGIMKAFRKLYDAQKQDTIRDYINNAIAKYPDNTAFIIKNRIGCCICSIQIEEIDPQPVFSNTIPKRTYERGKSITRETWLF